MKHMDTPLGLGYHQAAVTAIEMARFTNENVSFNFNGLEFIATPNSYVGDLCTIYDLKMKIERMEKGK